MKEIEIGQLRRVMGKPERWATLTRFESDDYWTVGRIITDSGLDLYSLELAWRDNAPEVSCIPDGDYEPVLTDKPKHGKCYEIPVEGRTAILIHPANLPRDIRGCIALGGAVGDLAGKKAVLGSRDAVGRFMADMEGEPFTLKVRWAPGVKPDTKAAKEAA